MSRLTKAALAFLLAACAPQVNKSTRKPSDAVSASFVIPTPPKNTPEPQPDTSKDNPDPQYLTKNELERGISQLISQGTKMIFEESDEPTVKKEVKYKISLSDIIKTQHFTYILRDVSFCVKDLPDGRRIYNLEIEAVYSYRVDGKTYFNKVKVEDGFLRLFDNDTLTFRDFQIEIDGFPEYEDEGHPNSYAAIINKEPDTWAWGSAHLALMTLTFRDLANRYKGGKLADLAKFPQSLGYPLYIAPPKGSLPRLPGSKTLSPEEMPKTMRF